MSPGLRHTVLGVTWTQGELDPGFGSMAAGVKGRVGGAGRRGACGLPGRKGDRGDPGPRGPKGQQTDLLSGPNPSQTPY